MNIQWHILREALRMRAARLWCRLFGHSQERVQKMWCSLCARCSAVVVEKARQAVLPAQRVEGGATTVPPSSKELTSLDEMLARMRELIHQHRAHPERTRAVEVDMERLVALKAALMPLPLMRVERSDFLAPAPWPEDALTPDSDFPRDAAP
jgi:hypothetical protein